MHVPNVTLDARFGRATDLRTGFETRSILAVAIRSARTQEVVGVLQALNKDGGGGDGFTGHDEELMLEIGRNIALNIGKMKDEEESKEQALEQMRNLQTGMERLECVAEEEGSRRAEEVSTLSQELSLTKRLMTAVHTINQEKTLDDLFSRVLEEVRRLVQADGAFFYLVEYSKDDEVQCEGADAEGAESVAMGVGVYRGTVLSLSSIFCSMVIVPLW